MSTLPVVAKQGVPGTPIAHDPGADEGLRREGLILRLARCMTPPGYPPFDSDLQALEAISAAVQQHAPWNGKAACDHPIDTRPLQDVARELSRQVSALYGLSQAIERAERSERDAAACREREAALRQRYVAAC